MKYVSRPKRAAMTTIIIDDNYIDIADDLRSQIWLPENNRFPVKMADVVFFVSLKKKHSLLI